MAKLTATAVFTVQFDTDNKTGTVDTFELRQKAATIIAAYFERGMAISEIESQMNASKIEVELAILGWGKRRCKRKSPY